MTAASANKAEARTRSPLLLVSWAGTLLAGYLPVVVWREVFGGSIAETLPLRIGVSRRTRSGLWQHLPPGREGLNRRGGVGAAQQQPEGKRRRSSRYQYERCNIEPRIEGGADS
jgi:hypothetical protein